MIPLDPTIFQQRLVEALPRLQAFAESLCGNRDRALDLVQTTSLRAWQHRTRFDPSRPLLPWLLTILRNCFYSEIRALRNESEDVDGEMAARMSIAPHQESAIDAADVSHLLSLLPAHQREALLLVVAEDLSYEEAAAVCNCSVGTVKSRISRARARLSEALDRSAVSGGALAPDSGACTRGLRRARG